MRSGIVGSIPSFGPNKHYRMIYLNMGHNDIDYEHKYDATNKTLSYTLNWVIQGIRQRLVRRIVLVLVVDVVVTHVEVDHPVVLVWSKRRDRTHYARSHGVLARCPAESWSSLWRAECRCRDSGAGPFPSGTTHWAMSETSRANGQSPDGCGLRPEEWPTSVATCCSRTIPTRGRCCDTSPSLPGTPKGSTQNRQSETPSRLHRAPCTSETQRVVRGLQDACPKNPPPGTGKDSPRSNSASWMWCQTENCTSPPSPETIVRPHARS